MTRVFASGACGAMFLFLACSGAAAQSAPSSNDMINALTAPSAHGETSRGFRLNHGAIPPSTSSDQPDRAHGGTTRHAAARREIGVPILFDLDSATMKSESTPMLDSIVKALQSPQLAGSRILLEGHTDASGGAAHNLVLSRQRAEAVKAALVQDGVDAARLTTAGKGQSAPANAADPLAAENRRVVLVNIS